MDTPETDTMRADERAVIAQRMDKLADPTHRRSFESVMDELGISFR